MLKALFLVASGFCLVYYAIVPNWSGRNQIWFQASGIDFSAGFLLSLAAGILAWRWLGGKHGR